MKPASDEHVELAQRLTTLTERVTRISASLAEAGRNLTERRALPPDDLVDEMAAVHSAFAELRDRVVAAAATLAAGPPPPITTLRELEVLVKVLVDENTRRARRHAAEQSASVADATRKAESPGQSHAADEARRRAQDEARRKAAEAEEAWRRAEAQAKRRAEEEAQRRTAEEARRKAEDETRRRTAEADEARRKAEDEARRQALAAAEERRRVAEAEARRKAAEAEEQRRKAEAETRRKAEEERRQAAEAEEQPRKAAAEAQARRRMEDEARRKAAAAEQERRKTVAEAEARRKAEEQARRMAVGIDESRRKAVDAEAKRKADQEAQREAQQAEEAARRRAEQEAASTAETAAEPAEPTAVAEDDTADAGLETAQWWISASASWASMRSKQITFAAAVSDLLTKYPYFLSVPIQTSADFDDGMVAYGYGILLEHIEQRLPNFVSDALARLVARPGASLGQRLYEYLAQAVGTSYGDFIKAVMLGAIPKTPPWPTGGIEDGETTTTVFVRPSARIGDIHQKVERFTQAYQRFGEHRFTAAVAPLTSRFFRVDALDVKEARHLGLRITEKGVPSDQAWVVSVPTRGGAPQAKRHIPQGTIVSGMGREYASVWVGVFNLDAENEKRYDVAIEITRRQPGPASFRKR